MLSRILIASLLIAAASFGEEEREETLFAPGPIRSGGFGGPVVKYSLVNGQSGALVGGRGGWILNSRISLGGGGYGLANRITGDHPDSARIDLGYGGFIVEGVLMPKRPLHATGSLLIGGGSVNPHGKSDGAETFFALEPEAELEINILHWFRFCPGISYRWLAGDTRLLDSGWDISGFSGGLTFKFGKF